MRIIIGFTQSDLAAGYSSFSDGYRAGADQRIVLVDVDTDVTDPEEVAEAVFAATNAPYEMTGLAGDIQMALARSGRHRSLSVGDTVTVGDVRLAVEPAGFRKLG